MSEHVEPFSISCTTCQAKLRVRDASAIGQILTCPKCGSMVLIEAPSSLPGQPIAKDKLKTSTPDRPGHRPPPRPATGPSHKPNEFADTVEDPTHYGTMKNPEGVEESPASTDGTPAELKFRPIDPALPTSSYDEMPDPDWMPDAAQQRRRWIFAGGAMLAGIGLAIAVFVYLASRSAPEVVRENSETNTGSKLPASGDGGSTIPPTTSQAPNTGSPAAGDTIETPESPTRITSPSEPASPGKGNESMVPPSTSDPRANLTVSVPNTPESPNLTAPEKTEPATAHELVPKDNEKTKADRMTPGGSLSDTLRKLGGLFDASEESPPSEPPTEPATATPTESATPSASTESTKLSRPAPRPVDVAARLADPILEIEFANTPLQDFLQFVSTLSTIPITLDPDVLVWLKLTPDTPVNVRLTSTTVAKLLDAALTNLGLAAVPVNNQLHVARKAAGDGLRKTQRNVAELIGDDRAQADKLREQIRELIAPESWTEAGGTGTAQIANGMLNLEQTDPILLEVSTFLERLRIARGLPKKSAFDEKLFRPISRTVRAAPQLAKPVTLNFSRPTPLPKIVRRLSQEVGMSILVDWQAVAQAGWNPDAEVTLTVTDKPVSDALVALLQPMELTYRIVDETTVQITTLVELVARHELEFYHVESLLGDATVGEGLLKQVHGAVPAEWFADSGGRGVMKFDDSSRCLLVLLSQPRQQAVEKLLHDWKSAGK